MSSGAIKLTIGNEDFDVENVSFENGKISVNGKVVAESVPDNLQIVVKGNVKNLDVKEGGATNNSCRSFNNGSYCYTIGGVGRVTGGTVTITNGGSTTTTVHGSPIQQTAATITVEGDCHNAKTVSGSIKVEGNSGSLNTTSGSITVGGSSGSINTVSGSVTVTGSSGGVNTVSGTINTGTIINRW